MPNSKLRRSMVQAERRVTVRDYFIFLLKLLLDGMKDGFLITLSTVAVAVDVLSGGGKRPRFFYSVLRMSERFDLWLNLNGAMERLDQGLDDDGLFGASEAGADTLLGKLEQVVRGGDQPGDGRRSPPSEPASGGSAAGGEPGPSPESPSMDERVEHESGTGPRASKT